MNAITQPVNNYTPIEEFIVPVGTTVTLPQDPVMHFPVVPSGLSVERLHLSDMPEYLPFVPEDGIELYYTFLVCKW